MSQDAPFAAVRHIAVKPFQVSVVLITDASAGFLVIRCIWGFVLILSRLAALLGSLTLSFIIPVFAVVIGPGVYRV